MASDAKMRASDADRDQVAAALREHHAAGRLTTEEFEERLEQAFAAKTLGDLDGLMADLPTVDLEQLREALAAQRPTVGPAEERPDEFVRAWRAVWRPWLVISLFFFVLWLVSGANDGPWFVFPSLVAGVVLMLNRLRSPRDGERDRIGTDRDRQRLGR